MTVDVYFTVIKGTVDVNFTVKGTVDIYFTVKGTVDIYFTVIQGTVDVNLNDPAYVPCPIYNLSFKYIKVS